MGRVCHGPSLLWAEMSSYRFVNDCHVQKAGQRVINTFDYLRGL